MATTRIEWLKAEPFTLVMSSGFFAFFAHTGMLQALLSLGARPQALAGSSAGALVGGAFAAGLSPEQLGQELLSLDRAQFWDPAPGLGLLRGRKFAEGLERMLPVRNLEETQLPVAISVFDVLTRKTRVRTTGHLGDTIRASCAVPGLFHPVWLDGRPHWDGGILDRPGLLGVAPGTRTLFHHIESKSPWRKFDSEFTKVPTRSNMLTMTLGELPRSGPFKLELGRKALHVARDRALAWLESPMDPA